MITTEIDLTSNSSLLEGATSLKPPSVQINWETDVVNQYIDIMAVVMINIQNNNMLISLFPHFAMYLSTLVEGWHGPSGLWKIGRSWVKTWKIISTAIIALGYLVGENSNQDRVTTTKKNISTRPYWLRAQSALLEKARRETTPKIPWCCINVSTRTGCMSNSKEIDAHNTKRPGDHLSGNDCKLDWRCHHLQSDGILLAAPIYIC